MSDSLVQLLGGSHHRPLFFEDEAGQAVTVNESQYRVILRDFLWPHFNGM